MRLEAFHAADGDCLLLTSADGHHLLVDGGRAGSFAENTHPRLQELRAAGEPLDVVLVSHVDADHITGILGLMRDLGDWAVFDYQHDEGENPDFPEPRAPRPPEVRALWHNSWHAQVGELEGPIAALALQVAQATAMDAATAAAAPGPTRVALDDLSGLAESIADGIQLTRLTEERTPLERNKGFPHHLVLLRDRPHRRRLGSTRLTVIGPTERHLEDFRDEWRSWLEKKGVPLTSGRTQAVRPETGSGRSLALGGRPPVTIEEAAQIIEKAGSNHVTPPNRASITVLAEEDGRSVLLTGDAAEEELIDGLEAVGKLGGAAGRESFHCTVLKVQHHGAGHNLSREFAERVIADHYVFSGNGAHDNPEPSVIATIVGSRPADAGPYTFWFTASATRENTPSRQKAMAAALKEADEAAERVPDLTVRVLPDTERSLVIDV